MDDYINFLAAQLAKQGFEIIIEDEGFSFKAKESVIQENTQLLLESAKHGQELNEFYRKRLDKVIA